MPAPSTRKTRRRACPPRPARCWCRWWKKAGDTLVLGCTHYPLLKPLLQSEAPHLALVDSALTTAEATAAALAEAGLLNPSQTPAGYHFYVSDIPLRFQTIGERFLGRSLEQIEMMRLG